MGLAGAVPAAAAAPGAALALAARPAPAPDELLAAVDRVATASSRRIRASITVGGARTAHQTRFELWTRGADALLRVLTPQREAGRAILFTAGRAFAYDPSWAEVRRVGVGGARAPWGRALYPLLRQATATSLGGRYTALSAGPCASCEPAAWTLRLAAALDSDAICHTAEVDVDAELMLPTEWRCVDVDGEVRRVRLSEYRDYGRRSVPTRMVLDDPAAPGREIRVRLLQVLLDAPLDRALFTLTALKAVE